MNFFKFSNEFLTIASKLIRNYSAIFFNSCNWIFFSKFSTNCFQNLPKNSVQSKFIQNYSTFLKYFLELKLFFEIPTNFPKSSEEFFNLINIDSKLSQQNWSKILLKYSKIFLLISQNFKNFFETSNEFFQNFPKNFSQLHQIWFKIIQQFF